MDFEEKLKKLRKDENKTLKQVSEALGVTLSAYSNYEQGIRKPDYNLLVSIAEYFNVTTDYLLGRED